MGHMHALVAEAMKKAAIIWVSTSDDQPAYPLWCASIGDALCVVVNGSAVSNGPGAGDAMRDDSSATTSRADPPPLSTTALSTTASSTTASSTAASSTAASSTATSGAEQPAPGLADALVATVAARGDHGGRIVTWHVHVEHLAPGGGDWNSIAPTLAAKRLNVPGSIDDLLAAWLKSAAILRLTPAEDEIVAPADGSGAAPARPTPAAARTAKPFRVHRVKRR
jgi:hypothetical protein